MRVTKTVKEYIEKCVREKVYKKYEAEEAEAKRQNDIVSNFEEEMKQLICKVAKEKIDAFLEENKFVEIFDDNWGVRYGYRLAITDSNCINSVHRWRRRADTEVYEKVTDIIVTLELGGTRADLDRMLSEI